jgi:flavin reductase (DIM6/NTAB) family NADH-FMN oxidoreductase RutF
VTVDLANLPADGTSLAKRKYAYLYARAFDGIQQIEEYDQRAYSPVVVEVGPEILGPNKPKPVLVNQAPTVDAGVDQTIVLPNSVILNGAVTDDGLPNGETTSTWSKVSGPGTVIFANAKAVDTTATASASGPYVLRLTASDGALTASDDVTVTANPAPVRVNQAPTVDAGVDQTIVLPNSVILNGAVTDDGLPNGETTSTWSKVSGPGTVIFANAKAVDTTATVSAIGSYVLRLTASDGALTASDDVAMTVKTAALPETTALNVTIQVVGTPKPGQQATFYVYVQDAAGKEISGATVDLYLDTGDADQEPNHRWTKTSATGGRVTFRVSTNSGDRLPWTLTAVARKGDVQGTGTLTVQ